jgi:hypothetical protein
MDGHPQTESLKRACPRAYQRAETAGFFRRPRAPRRRDMGTGDPGGSYPKRGLRVIGRTIGIRFNVRHAA